MQREERKLKYSDIEQDATNSECTLEDYTLSLWIFLLRNKENCKSLGRELGVRKYSNPGNVYEAVLKRLIGHIDSTQPDPKGF